MKTNKLKKYEKKIESPITENQHRANVALAAEKLLTIIEKTRNPAPVAESFDSLLNQLKSGDVKRSPVVVNHADGRRIRYGSGNAEILPGESTLGITPDVTLGITSELTKKGASTFTDIELELLRKIQNVS